MSEEKLTSEEAQALEAMEQDTSTGDVTEETTENTAAEATETPAEGDKAESGETPQEPEFKSTRAEEKPPEGFVPHQAMHAERVKRQELEKKLEELEARLPKEEEDQEPQFVDPLEDPEGFKKWSEWQTEKNEAFRKQQQEHTAEQQAIAQRVRKAREYEAEFTAKAPDYGDAVKFLASARQTELQNMGYSPDEVMGQLEKDARGIYDAATAIGMNPAEMAYMRAQSLGYKKTDVKPEEVNLSEGDKVTALAKTQENVEGLGSTGAPQEGQLTVAAMAEMSEDELAKIPEDQFKRVMGG